MTDFINMTPHSIEVYPAAAFSGLEQVNSTTWVADSVDKTQAIATYESQGVARIETEVKQLEFHSSKAGVPMVATTYGKATGIPDNYYQIPNNLLPWFIVSLPMQSMARASNHPLANVMVAPYQVVRQKDNGSVVLGCMGFTF